MTPLTSDTAAPDAHEVRIRRALWRAEHRGTKELDILIGGFAKGHLTAMSPGELDLFEEFLAVSDIELQRWILIPGAVADDKFESLVASIKRFHGLT